MAWIPAAIGAVGSIAGGALSGGQGGEHKGVSETLWKDSIPGITDIRQLLEGLLGQSPTNPNIEGGLNGMANIGQTLGPLLGYGQGVMGAGLPSLMNAYGLGGQIAGFNPAQSQAGFTPGQAANANYNPAIANQIMQGAPVDQAIQAATRDMYRGLNWDTLPQLKNQAAGSNNSGSSKLNQQNTLAEQMTADRASDVAANMYSQAYGQGVGVGGQYGLTNAGFQQQNNQQNAGIQNDMALRQGMNNAGMMNQYGLGALTNSADIFGSLLNQSAGMFGPMAGLMQGIPQMQYQAGLGQRDNAMGYYNSLLGPLMNIATGGGTAGQAGYSPNYGQASPWPAVFGQLGSAAINSWGGGTPTNDATHGGVAANGSVYGGGSAWSDARLKRNIRAIGTAGPLTLCSWAWGPNELGLSGTGTGVIAQEVAQHYPECVGEAHGFLTVDYGRLAQALEG